MIKLFYVLVRTTGQTLYELFDCYFGFPSWREVERYQAKRQMTLDLLEVNFSLSKQSFRSLAREYIPEHQLNMCVSQ
jgi:hypothetical protein